MHASINFDLTVPKEHENLRMALQADRYYRYLIYIQQYVKAVKSGQVSSFTTVDDILERIKTYTDSALKISIKEEE